MTPDDQTADRASALAFDARDVGQPGHPERVGSYRIARILGQGGMGVVYLAEQDEPVRRQVAIKVLRSGLNTQEIVARFRSEEQALAVMEHTNITRVYDAGATESGLPYFVMEYVVGESITEYSAGHVLGVRDRVNLFMQVCRAVQHAHQKGIVHRDIKPSNVIVCEVDGEPVCKVIDFGIAKAIEPSAGSARLTMTGMALGTPAYMSPEQFLTDGTDIDTRADIYALGVMLYELLAGVLPFDPDKHSGWAALLAQHVTADAPAPSTQFAALPAERRTQIASERHTSATDLRHALSGDLDAIVLNAMQRDREERYATPNAFSLDLERYLENKPVAAQTASWPYRARKFTRRHRVGVAFATTLFALLSASAIGANIQAQRLARARAVAEARQGQAEDLISFMLGDLRDKLTAVGRLDVLDDVGAKAMTYFAAVPTSQLTNGESFRRAQALQQLGEVRMAQGKLPAAGALMRQSLAIATRLASLNSSNEQWQIGLAHSHFWAGNVDWEQGNVDSALNHFLPFVTISRKLIAAYPDSLSYREELAYALNNIGFAHEARGDVSGALASYRASLAINQALVDRDPSKLDWQTGLAAEHNAAAVAQRKLGDLKGALSDHDEELAIRSAVFAHDTTNRERERYVGIARAYRGELRMLMGDISGSLADENASHAIYAALVANDTSNASLVWGLARSDRQIAQATFEGGDAASAARHVAEARLLTDRLLSHPPNPRAAAEAILSGTLQCRIFLALGRKPAALAAATGAAEAAAAAAQKKPDDIERQRAAGDALDALGEVLASDGKHVEAQTAWMRGLALIDPIAKRYPETEVLAVQAVLLTHLGRAAVAAPVIAELKRRGHRRPSFEGLTHPSSRSSA